VLDRRLIARDSSDARRPPGDPVGVRRPAVRFAYSPNRRGRVSGHLSQGILQADGFSSSLALQLLRSRTSSPDISVHRIFRQVQSIIEDS